MKKFFLLISALTLSMATFATKPTITIDGDKSDWADVPMLSEPGTWPMLKVLPAADAELGTNALAFLLENSEAFTSDWSKYPGTYIDKDYNLETNPYNSGWIYTGMGIDYAFTTGASINDKWVDFPTGKSEDYKAIELGVPSTYITDLGEKFGIGMYYGTGSSQEIWIPRMSGNEISPRIGYLYKTSSYTTIPGTAMAANAYAHQSIKECTDYVDFGLRDNGYDTIRWAAFPIELTTQGVYDVTANVTSTNGWKFEFWLVDVATNAVVAHIDAPASNVSESKTSYNFGIMDLSRVPSGKYMLKVKNRTAFSKVKLNSVTLSYVGGAVQNISTAANTTLNVADALFTDGFTRANGQVSPGSWKPAEPNPLGYVKWNIATSETKFYDLTLNFSSTNGHSMKVNIYEDEEASPVATVSESFTETTGTLTLTDRVNLVGGKNYIVKVTNPTSGSQAKVTSVVFAPVVATATTLPGTLAFSNAVLSEKANITNGMLYFNEPGADKDPRGQWTQWEVTTDHDGLFLFTMGVTSENGQNYKITIKDDSDNELDYYETSLDSGDKTVTHYFALSAGNYFVKVENTRSYSKGHLTSLVVTEPAGVVTLDEAATSTDSWADKVVDKSAEGPLYDVQIIRTIKAGMYNTFCLPFAVSPDMCKDIFGSDVQIRTLDSATVDEDFVLTLDFKKSSDIYPGTPVLIQTSRDIVNPVFTGVKFTRATPSATTKTNANFVGTFIKDEIPASEDNLFLGANNTLYFPTVNMPILGMRAYFVIHNVPAGAIKRARIIENEQVATEIELIMEQPKANSQKLIENGQLIIIRDGIRYNALGIKLQ